MLKIKKGNNSLFFVTNKKIHQTPLATDLLVQWKVVSISLLNIQGQGEEGKETQFVLA
jgi:hypothetical protein